MLLKVKYLKISKKSRSGKKLIGLAKLSYLQDPMSDRNYFLSATLLTVYGVYISQLYPRGTSNDAPKQIIVCYRLTIDCCFKISA